MNEQNIIEAIEKLIQIAKLCSEIATICEGIATSLNSEVDRRIESQNNDNNVFEFENEGEQQ